MPKRTDITSILVIGAGPIVIGQACEFDYSGVQAVKALKSEGYRVILVNSNPATIMTDPDLADATYIEPITPEFLERIIRRERPDALLPTMGGQTALNCALELFRSGVLNAHGVEMIGAKADVIEKAEDRRLFRNAMEKIGLQSPRAAVASSTPIRNKAGKTVGYDRASGLAEAMRALEEIGLRLKRGVDVRLVAVLEDAAAREHERALLRVGHEGRDAAGCRCADIARSADEGQTSGQVVRQAADPGDGERRIARESQAMTAGEIGQGV